MFQFKYLSITSDNTNKEMRWKLHEWTQPRCITWRSTPQRTLRTCYPSTTPVCTQCLSKTPTTLPIDTTQRRFKSDSWLVNTLKWLLVVQLTGLTLVWWTPLTDSTRPFTCHIITSKQALPTTTSQLRGLLIFHHSPPLETLSITNLTSSPTYPHPPSTPPLCHKLQMFRMK